MSLKPKKELGVRKIAIAVDFDGTIVEHKFPAIGQPVPNAIEWIKKWSEKGAKIILWTVRSGDYLEHALDYVAQNEIELFGVNKNPEQQHFSHSPKAYAAIYVDDAAFGCPLHQPTGFDSPVVNWNVVGPDVLQKIN